MSIVKDVVPRWHEDADAIYGLLRDPKTVSAKHRVDASGKEIPDTSKYLDAEFWPDRLLLKPDPDGGDDYLVVDYSEYEDIYWDDYSPGWRWEGYVRRLDVERHERQFPVLTAQPPYPPTKASKPAGSAKPDRKPSSAQERRNAAIQNRLESGDRPPSNVTWPRFCHAVRVEGDGFIGDPKDEKYKRGFSDDTIEGVTRKMMKSLAL